MTQLGLHIRIDQRVRRLARRAEAQSPGLRRVVLRGLDVAARGAWHLWRNRHYLSAAKLLNMAVVNLEMRLGRERLAGRPYVFKIEPTNLCNTTCRLCPTGLGFAGRPRGKMTLAQFQRIIDRIKSFAYAVDLSNWGDPLIVPDIYAMVSYAHRAGMWTYLSSNLHAFRPDRGDAEAMVRSGLDMLNCSLHGVSQAAYAAYQPGKQIGPILDRIRALVDTKRRLGSFSPVIRLFFVVTRRNEHEIDAFRLLAEQLGAEAVFIPASLNLRLAGRDANLQDLGWSPDECRNRRDLLKREWLPADPRWVAPWYRAEPADPPAARTRRVRKPYTCTWPWQAMVINWDGGVSACCGVLDQREDLGNVFTTPLTQVWNSPAYQAVRRSFRETIPPGTGEPCRSCPGILI